jgi:hypothetical protein
VSTSVFVVAGDGEEVHLGVSSIGWAFTFRAYLDPLDSPAAVTWLVNDYASWLRLLDLGEIRDEYGQAWTREDLLARVAAKRGGLNALSPELHDFLDDGGNRFVPLEFC